MKEGPTARSASSGPRASHPLDDLDAWLARLAASREIGSLLSAPWTAQLDQGYGHTLREICQQPVTWLATAATLASSAGLVEDALRAAGIRDGRGALVLTGSGSSLFVGDCSALPLQEALGVPVCAVSAGQILTHPRGSLPPAGPYLVVSFARSGDSPESRAVVDDLLVADPRASHLIITCSRAGALAAGYRGEPRVRSIVLDERTNDKSLVMTSSFTSMALAARLLAQADTPEEYQRSAQGLAAAGAMILLDSADALAGAARNPFSSVVYLGSGCRFGAAREAALKMLELNDGRVSTLSESYLGLRHGPMSAVRDDTLVVAFLSSDPVVRAYEVDLMRELDRKKLGLARVVVGAGLPPELATGPRDVRVDVGSCSGIPLRDGDLALLDVVVGQILAFFRCRSAGLRPDAPSNGVINRVVGSFTIHPRS